MARPLRIEFDGALYHVTSRGNERKNIYYDDEDRALFLDVLQRVNEKYNWLCHAYCLMDNHYHLVIETPEGNLSKGMRQLNGLYTQRINRRHNRVGHVFQGRFKAIVIQKESHLLETCRYVVLNPVRAGAATRPDEWRWSSYGATMGVMPAHPCLTVEWVLGQFGKRKDRARITYGEFINAGTGKGSLWENVRGQILLGEEEFINKLSEHAKKGAGLHEIPRSQRHLRRPSLRKLFGGVAERDKAARNKLIVAAVYEHGYGQREVANFLGLHYSTISVVVLAEKNVIR